MIAAENQVIRKAVVQSVASAHPTPRIGLEQYYSEAGPDYAAWSREFNMHFGYYRAGSKPLHREAMLEQMNAEVLARLQLESQMFEFERSSSGSMCSWLGLRTFNVTALIAENVSEANVNVRWNSPTQQSTFSSPDIQPYQESMLPEEDASLLPEPLPA